MFKRRIPKYKYDKHKTIMLVEFHELLHVTKIDMKPFQRVYTKLVKYHEKIQTIQTIQMHQTRIHCFFIQLSYCLFRIFNFINYEKTAYQITPTHTSKNCVSTSYIAHIIGDMIRPLGYDMTLGVMGIRGNEHICFGMGDLMCVYSNTLNIQLKKHVDLKSFNAEMDSIYQWVKWPSLKIPISHMAADDMYIYSRPMDIKFMLMNMYLKWYIIINTSASHEVICEWYGKYYSFCYNQLRGKSCSIVIKCNRCSIGSFYYIQHNKIYNSRRFDKFLLGVKYPDYSYNDMFIPYRMSLVFNAHRDV